MVFVGAVYEESCFRWLILPAGTLTCYASQMPRVLLTAFEPYEPWPTNASWLALVELTGDLPSTPDVTTRLYPVELAAIQERLAADLKVKYDVIVHLGAGARIWLHPAGGGSTQCDPFGSQRHG